MPLQLDRSRHLPPLVSEEQLRYSYVIEQIEAVFALECMTPNRHDELIKAAILAGQISLEDAREQLLAHFLRYKTLAGFKVRGQHDAF